MRVDDVKECPECRSRHLERDYDRGELVCGDCGLVIDDMHIDQGPDWRIFEGDGKGKVHAGAPMSVMHYDKGLPTTMGYGNKDINGRHIPAKSRSQIYRMRKWQRRIRVSNATERNLAYALSDMDRVASALYLPHAIRETSSSIYRQAVKMNLIRGRSIEGVVAASLYAACRKHGVPRTLDEISDCCKIDRKEIGRTYRFMARAIGLKLNPTSPKDYISRFCSELKLSSNILKMADDLLDKAIEMELVSGRGPTGLAAASIYISAVRGGERRTLLEVAGVACVTEVTIRNRYKELIEALGMAELDL